MKNVIHEAYTQSISCIRDSLGKSVDKIQRVTDAILDAVHTNKKILIFGNGGSAAQAQHLASELVNRLSIWRKPVAAIALTTDGAVITSIANDIAYELVFGRQIEAIGNPGDIALAISTSGNSGNIVNALSVAKQKGMVTISILGRDGGLAKVKSDIAIVISGDSTHRIQEVHFLLCHIICEIIERALV